MLKQEIDNSYIAFGINQPWRFGNVPQSFITDEWHIDEKVTFPMVFGEALKKNSFFREFASIRYCRIDAKLLK